LPSQPIFLPFSFIPALSRLGKFSEKYRVTLFVFLTFQRKKNQNLKQKKSEFLEKKMESENSCIAFGHTLMPTTALL
jgi:hypothetical protein